MGSTARTNGTHDTPPLSPTALDTAETLTKTESGPTGWHEVLSHLADEYEESARTLRRTLTLLADYGRHARHRSHAQMLAAALEIDAARAAARVPPARPLPATPPVPETLTGRIAQRTRTAALLARFSDVPLALVDPRLKTLQRHGYLAGTPDGYVRTSKPFHIDAADSVRR